MVGGGETDSATSSLAFDGVQSDFNPNMIDRSFGCKQPTWGPKCV